MAPSSSSDFNFFSSFSIEPPEVALVADLGCVFGVVFTTGASILASSSLSRNPFRVSLIFYFSDKQPCQSQEMESHPVAGFCLEPDQLCLKAVEPGTGRQRAPIVREKQAVAGFGGFPGLVANALPTVSAHPLAAVKLYGKQAEQQALFPQQLHPYPPEAAVCCPFGKMIVNTLPAKATCTKQLPKM